VRCPSRPSRSTWQSVASPHACDAHGLRSGRHAVLKQHARRIGQRKAQRSTGRRRWLLLTPRCQLGQCRSTRRSAMRSSHVVVMHAAVCQGRPSVGIVVHWAAADHKWQRHTCMRTHGAASRGEVRGRSASVSSPWSGALRRACARDACSCVPACCSWWRPWPRNSCCSGLALRRSVVNLNHKYAHRCGLSSATTAHQGLGVVVAAARRDTARYPTQLRYTCGLAWAPGAHITDDAPRFARTYTMAVQGPQAITGRQGGVWCEQ
jgi:hypothetical protein